jgi:5-methylcytosine-specific restriction enzyme B
MSFVVFPTLDVPCLLGLVVGTQGLSPDEEILARPGHARKVSAICAWLNHRYGKGKLCAWAKQDPVRTDLEVPLSVGKAFSPYGTILERYGKVLYGIFAPTGDVNATVDATKAFLDLMFGERKQFPLKSEESDAETHPLSLFRPHAPSRSRNGSRDVIAEPALCNYRGPTWHRKNPNGSAPSKGKARGVSQQFLTERH